MAAEWLRAEQVAAETAGHHEVLTTFTDLTGRTNTLREGGCAKCGERWPCLAVQWAAQDGRWRALVGDAIRILYLLGGDEWPSMQPWLAQAQAALDGAE